MCSFQKNLTACFGFILFLSAGSVSQAAFHLYQIGEVYSNASGTVQFVELFTDQSSQQFVSFTSFTTNTHTYAFPDDLPADSANTHFILATPGYVALSMTNPNVPHADYDVGVNNFFSTTGDTLTLVSASFGPSLTFTSGQLPTDGVHSLNRAYLGGFTEPPTTFTTAVNSPTNFAGVAGSIPPPALVGDANNDSHVNAADVLAMMDALTGTTTPPALANVDVNQDNKFTNADLQSLLKYLKDGNGSLTSVPEPVTFVLAALVASIVGLRFRRAKSIGLIPVRVAK